MACLLPATLSPAARQGLLNLQPAVLVRVGAGEGEGGVGSPGAVRICSLEIQGSRDSAPGGVAQLSAAGAFFAPTAFARSLEAPALTSCWRILWIGDARRMDRWISYLREAARRLCGIALNRVVSESGSNRADSSSKIGRLRIFIFVGRAF